MQLFLEGLAIGLETTIMTSFFGKIMNRLKAAFDKGDMETARLEQVKTILNIHHRQIHCSQKVKDI